MENKLENELRKLSPDFLIEMDGSEIVTCMHWGLDCGDGWYEPLKRFLIKVNELNNKLIEVKFVAKQIKEKWGEIRVYWQLEEAKGDIFERKTGDYEKYKSEVEEFEKYLAELEKEISVTCEHCGKIQEPLKQTSGWISYLCDDCFQKWQNRNEWNA